MSLAACFTLRILVLTIGSTKQRLLKHTTLCTATSLDRRRHFYDDRTSTITATSQVLKRF
jgi:hypothetical protein